MCFIGLVSCDLSFSYVMFGLVLCDLDFGYITMINRVLRDGVLGSMERRNDEKGD